MPKPKRARTRPVGIVAGVKGRKTTFADDSDGDEAGAAPEAGPSRLSVPRAAFSEDDEDEDEDEDSDDAPEAVGLAQGKEHRVEEEQREAERARQKRQAARLRSDKIAALKAKQKEEAEARARKGKRKARAEEDAEDEDEDEATMRLRRRMEAAMADGEDESDDVVSGNESDDIDEDEDDENEDDEDEDEEDDEDEEQDEEDEDEEEDGDESDYSETLEDGPLTDAERKMRERIQAAMEAAEARAGLAPRKPKSALKHTTSTPTVTATAAETKDAEEESFDLTPYHSAVKPLPQHVLDAAARAQAEKKAVQATAQSAKPNDRALKRKRQRQKAVVRPAPSSRALSDDKTLHLLPTVLDTNSPLPPVIKPGALRPTGVRNTFIKTAMKKSGVGVPGRGLVDGRRRKGASLSSSAR